MFTKKYINKIGSKIKQGSLRVIFPNNEEFLFKGKDGLHGELILKSYKPILRTLVGGHLGFAESYLKNEWESPNLENLLELMLQNLPNEFKAKSNLYKTYNRFIHFLRKNTKIRAKKNIEYHYDIGNSFYEIWLDKSMTYSSALFKNDKEDLYEAQINKYQTLVEQLDIKPHHNVLEIGCGWGGMAEYIGKELGCSYTGITISPSQKSFTEDRIKNNSLKNSEVHLCDYRDLKGSFDRIISIEMIEAVGEKYWDTYFSKINEVLKKDGLAGIQMILIDNKQFDSYRKSVDFIQKYIFPGGMLPSVKALEKIANQKKFDFQIKNQMADSYYQTLEMWRKNFNNKWDIIKNLGYSEDFKRMWNFYLSYCSGGFKAKTIDVYQIDFINK